LWCRALKTQSCGTGRCPRCAESALNWLAHNAKLAVYDGALERPFRNELFICLERTVPLIILALAVIDDNQTTWCQSVINLGQCGTYWQVKVDIEQAPGNGRQLRIIEYCCVTLDEFYAADACEAQ
jgi:hypothetical protein